MLRKGHADVLRDYGEVPDMVFSYLSVADVLTCSVVGPSFRDMFRHRTRTLCLCILPAGLQPAHAKFVVIHFAVILSLIHI